MPVGYGQRRRAWVLVAALCFSRVMAGALVFSKEAHDVLWALGRCLGRLGGLPGVLVTDREGCLHAGSGRPTDEYAAFCGQLAVGWHFCDPGDAEAKGLSRTANGSFARALSRGGRSPTICISRTSWTVGSTLALTALPPLASLSADRSARAGARADAVVAGADARYRPALGAACPGEPYLRFDTNDYSLDPRVAGRRVEVSVSQREMIAVELETGKLACRHGRFFAGHRTDTAQEHARALRAAHRPRASLRSRCARWPDTTS